MTELLKREFKGFAVHNGFYNPRTLPKAPCFVIDVIDFFESEPIETGQIDITTRWEIRHIIPKKTGDEKSHIIARDIAAQLAAKLHNRRPCKSAGYFTYVNSIDENFDVTHPEVEIWLSEFDLKIRAGIDVWTDPELYKAYIGEYPREGEAL